mmetsp:Transcript_13196/g.35231  ORF Transcript_13196/g.35231 Transcript_13196/m.35231 type:complete len:206 (+) Transcript_13196:711-1328(+)
MEGVGSLAPPAAASPPARPNRASPDRAELLLLEKETVGVLDDRAFFTNTSPSLASLPRRDAGCSLTWCAAGLPAMRAASPCVTVIELERRCSLSLPELPGESLLPAPAGLSDATTTSARGARWGQPKELRDGRCGRASVKWRDVTLGSCRLDRLRTSAELLPELRRLRLSVPGPVDMQHAPAAVGSSPRSAATRSLATSSMHWRW